MSRPTLNDPTEYALIKKMYFQDDSKYLNNDVDPIEENDRIESRLKNSKQQSR